jgi:hypothetical protein
MVILFKKEMAILFKKEFVQPLYPYVPIYEGKDPLLRTVLYEYEESDRSVVIPYSAEEFKLNEEIELTSDLIGQIDGVAVVLDSMKTGRWWWQKRHIINIGYITPGVEDLLTSFKGELFYRFSPGKEIVSGRRVEKVTQGVNIRNMGKYTYQSAYVVLGNSVDSLIKQTESVFNRLFGPSLHY